MKTLTILLSACLALPAVSQDDKPKEPKPPRVEAVFVLDTTGSMGGLIDGAKKKIWSIVNEIARGKPTPTVKVGFVIYRDKGDEYVTKVFGLTDDLDQAFAGLQKFAAAGGGDTPEHVSRALAEAVSEIKWSQDKETYKVIFLVGDAEPHTNYDDGFDYKKACAAAVRADIVINTVRCGTSAICEKFWKEIATLGEGRYMSVAQSGGMAVVETPYDKDLAALGGKIDETRVARAGKEKELEKKCPDLAGGGAPAATPAMAERAAFNAKSGQMFRSVDLVTDIVEGRAKLDDLKEEEMPDVLKNKSKEERRKFIDQKIEERKELTRKLRELEEKRAAYLKEQEAKKGKTGDSFDGAVLKAIEEQASKKGIVYEK